MPQRKNTPRLKTKTLIESDHDQNSPVVQVLFTVLDSTLVRAAAVRKHKPLLDTAAETLNEGEIPSIYYHRKCRKMFSMKKLLETISKPQQGTDDQQPTAAKRTSIRQSPTTSTAYEHVCIFCEKKSKYLNEGTTIGKPWYNGEICVQITQLENQPWKRRTAGFSQLCNVKS